MQASSLFFSLLLVAASLGRAGVIITQEVDKLGGLDGKTELTMTLSDDRARVDVGRQLSSIVDLKSGRVVSLMHAQKIAMELPDGAIDAVKQKALAKSEKPSLEATGKKETINGFACEEYTGKLQGLDVTYWVTKDVANEKEILDQMGKLSGNGNPFKGALADGRDFPGFPIRTTIKSPQTGTSTITVTSVKVQDIPGATFKTPDGYKSMSVPPMSPSGGGAPAAPVR